MTVLKSLELKVGITATDEQRPFLLSLMTDEQLLAELIRRNPVSEGAVSRTPPDHEAVVAIGNDHIAWIYIGDEDLRALNHNSAAYPHHLGLGAPPS